MSENPFLDALAENEPTINSRFDTDRLVERLRVETRASLQQWSSKVTDTVSSFRKAVAEAFEPVSGLNEDQILNLNYALGNRRIPLVLNPGLSSGEILWFMQYDIPDGHYVRVSDVHRKGRSYYALFQRGNSTEMNAAEAEPVQGGALGIRDGMAEDLALKTGVVEIKYPDYPGFLLERSTYARAGDEEWKQYLRRIREEHGDGITEELVDRTALFFVCAPLLEYNDPQEEKKALNALSLAVTDTNLPEAHTPHGVGRRVAGVLEGTGELVTAMNRLGGRARSIREALTELNPRFGDLEVPSFTLPAYQPPEQLRAYMATD